MTPGQSVSLSVRFGYDEHRRGQTAELAVELARIESLGGDQHLCEGTFPPLDEEQAEALDAFLRRQVRAVARFLGDAPLFETWNREQLDVLAQSANTWELARRETLFCEGDEDHDKDGLFIVHRGTIRIYKGRDPDAEGRTLAVLTPGQIFGEMSLIEPGPHHGSVVALVPARLLVINQWSMHFLRAHHPQVAALLIETVARVLVRRLSFTTEKLFSPVGV